MEIAMLLLQAGAEKEFKQKIRRRGIWHPPVLGEAAKNKNLEMTQLLLNHGATSKLHPKSNDEEKVAVLELLVPFLMTVSKIALLKSRNC
jgi:hypothetical protein